MFSQVSQEGRLAQVNLREGERGYGENSIEALLIELSQLDNMTAFTPLLVNELSNK